MKKVISILWGIFMISAFLTQAFGQKELEVMKRYDYSSPKASFESLKKAIKEKDIEGIAIHTWRLFKDEKGSRDYGMSFEGCLADLQSNYSKAEDKDIMFQEADMIYKDHVKITELDFIKELGIMPDEEKGFQGRHWRYILLERKSDGKQIKACAVNFDGTKEWWISIERTGE